MLAVVREEIEALGQRWQDRLAVLDLYGATPQGAVVAQHHLELRQLLNRIEERLTYLSVEQYAAAHGVHPRAVRGWLRARRLRGQKNASGEWIIPYGAVPRKRERRETHEQNQD